MGNAHCCLWENSVTAGVQWQKSIVDAHALPETVHLDKLLLFFYIQHMSACHYHDWHMSSCTGARFLGDIYKIISACVQRLRIFSKIHQCLKKRTGVKEKGLTKKSHTLFFPGIKIAKLSCYSPFLLPLTAWTCFMPQFPLIRY